MNPDLSNTQGAPEPISPNPVGAGPAPTPTPNQNPFITPEPAPMQNPAPAPNFAPAQEPTPMAPQPMQTAPLPPKKKNTTTIVLVVILVLLVIGCGVAAAIMFWPKGGNNGGSTSRSGGSTPTTPVTPDAPDEPEEVAFTDAASISSITSKLKKVFIPWSDEEGRSFSNRSYIFHDVEAFEEGKTSKKIAVYNSIMANMDNFVEITQEEIETIKNQPYGQTAITTLDASIVANTYEDIFGEELDKTTPVADDFYHYNSDLDKYIDEGGKGGSTNYYRYYYINKFTKKGDIVNVYVSGATVVGGEGKTYCGIFYPDYLGIENTSMPEVCVESDDPDFELNSTNYEKYEEQVFHFKKADDGSYYFADVE